MWQSELDRVPEKSTDLKLKQMLLGARMLCALRADRNMAFCYDTHKQAQEWAINLPVCGAECCHPCKFRYLSRPSLSVCIHKLEYNREVSCVMVKVIQLRSRYSGVSMEI